MRAFKSILLVGTAALALSACSSDRGPGDIGSRNDIIIRNAGDPKAPPPPTHEKAAEQAAQIMAEEQKMPSAQEVVEAAEKEVVVKQDVDNVEETASVALSQDAENISGRAIEKITQEAKAETSAVEPLEDKADIREQIVPEEAAQAVPEKAEMSPSSVSTAGPMKRVQMKTPPSAQASQVVETSTPTSATEAAPTQDSAPSAPEMLVDLTDIDMAALHGKTPDEVRVIQKALKAEGFYDGPFDGKVNAQTLNALVRYRAKNKLLPQELVPVKVERKTPAPLPVSQKTEMMDSVMAEPKAAVLPTPVLQPSAPTVFKAGAVNIMDPALIRAVQGALGEKGFYNGPATGVMDTSLLNALSRYQSANTLSPGGLTTETLTSLGLVK